MYGFDREDEKSGFWRRNLDIEFSKSYRRYENDEQYKVSNLFASWGGLKRGGGYE